MGSQRKETDEGSAARTDDEGNHAGAISAGGLETLDELLDFPNLNVLLRLTLIWCGTHACGVAAGVRRLKLRSGKNYQ